MMTLDELVALGRRQHDDENFYAALNTYGGPSLVKDSDTKAVSDILDLRIYTYLKLNNLSGARRDATSILRISKQDGRGYVWCGRVEKLAGDIPAAIQWYEHGIKRISESDHLHAYVKEQLRKLTVANRPRDPIAFFPAEVLEFVLFYLDFREVSRARRVSKRWAEALLTIRPLSESIDFRLNSQPVSTGALKAALKHVKRSAKTLHMSNLTEPARVLLKSHLASWDNFQKLQDLSFSKMDCGIWALPFSRYPLRSMEIGDENGVEIATAMHILKTCKALEIARFHDVLVPGNCYPDVVIEQEFRPGVTISLALKVLQFDCHAGPRGYINLESVLNCFPSLTEVECSYASRVGEQMSCDLSRLQNLRKLRFHNVSSYLPKLPSFLEALGYSSCSFRSPNPHDTFGRLYHHLSNLRILSVVDCSNSLTLAHFIPPGNASKLTHLEWTDKITWPDNLPIALEHLRVLRLRCPVMAVGSIPNLIKLLELEELHLTSCTTTTVEIADLIRSPESRLRDIRLVDCPYITPDILTLAERKGEPDP